MAKLEADDHRHGLIVTSPLACLVMLVVCATAYYFFSMLQITSTEQTVFALLQVNAQLVPSMTGAQVASYASGDLGRFQTIAAAIGYGVQIALLTLSFSPDATLLLMHQKYNGKSSASLSKHAGFLAKLRLFMLVVLIGGDILTDFWYVISGHSLDGGVVLVGIIYPTAICFVTIYGGKYMFVFLDRLIDHMMQWKESQSSKPAPSSSK
jgi:hypothetical protein